MKKILYVFVLLLCGVTSGYAQQAPVLVTTTLDGKTFDLAALKGKVVIVHFWATWCTACREEMPVLNAFYTSHHAQGVEVIAISMDRPRARDRVVQYMQDFHFPASLIGDAATNSFDTPGVLPVTYIIDTQGVVRSVLTPDKTVLTQATLDNIVQPLLPR